MFRLNWTHSPSLRPLSAAACVAALLASPLAISAQTASTGAVRGTVTDASGALVAGAHARITVLGTGETREVSTGSDGGFVVSLLPSGNIKVEITKNGFHAALVESVAINVTETRNLAIRLTVGDVSSETSVTAQTAALHTDGTALGDVVSGEQLAGLPLVSRNYTQVIALSAGVTADVTNAATAGRGEGGSPEPFSTVGNTYAHGDRGYDNDFLINGLEVNDVKAQGASSGGVAIPNPDMIGEFKVQTAQYDAAFGRKAGASVDVITKSGSNAFHGTVFEFFRNTDLNANDYFSKLNGNARPELNQNQFGGTIGGPVKKDKLFFFGSYQGTRQVNAVGNVTTVSSPLFTNDRSAQALGTLFAGQRGYFQNAFGGLGPAIAADGSNINPAALAILQAKLPNGQYLVPTPQRVVNGAGLSTYAPATRFNEDQYMGNADYQVSSTQHVGARLFTAGSNLVAPEVYGNLPDGYSQSTKDRFVVSSLEHDWIVRPNLLNEFRIGYNRTFANTTQASPYSFSDLGILAPAANNATPGFNVEGSDSFGGASHAKRVQDMFLGDETLAWTHGKHNLRVGGGAAKTELNFSNYSYGGELTFLSWPDLMLGLSAAQDGLTNGPFPPIGNIYISVMVSGDFDRANRVWETYGYGQDDYRVKPNLTLNFGVRYDWLPPMTDASGRQGNLDLNRVNQDPSAAGTLAGVVVSHNFPGAVPVGVTQNGGGYVVGGNDDNSFGPRLGFSWQPLSGMGKTVVRGGYGIYYSRISGQVQSQGSTAQPFGNLSALGGPAAGGQTLQNPFPASIPTTFPTFTPYSPSTAQTATVVANNVRPGFIQQASFGVQQELGKKWVLELTTVGTRGTHVLRTLAVNQAQIATASAPIHGETTTTVDNIEQRVPYLGFTADGLNQVQSEGAFWYNDLEATLRKQFGHGMTLQAAYTWSKTLDTDAVNSSVTGSASSGVGNAVGNHSRYGVADFSRPQRLVVSYVYDLPYFHDAAGLKGVALGGWGVSGVTTIQSGHSLTVQGTNGNSAYGVDTDYGQLVSGCGTHNEGKGGSVQSKIGATNGRADYFNDACFFTAGSTAAYPVIGDDGAATGFGNSGIGVVRGPAQNNYDISILKHTRIPLNSVSNVEFRAEMFNAFNTPQFSDPDTLTSDSTFGSITGTSVAPRIVQFGLKINY